MAPRIKCQECGRSHNGPEGARRCRARAIYDADVARQSKLAQEGPVSQKKVKPQNMREFDAVLQHIGRIAYVAGDSTIIEKTNRCRQVGPQAVAALRIMQRVWVESTDDVFLGTFKRDMLPLIAELLKHVDNA